MIIPVEEAQQQALNRFLWRHRRYVQSLGIISAGLLTADFLMRWRIFPSDFSAALLFVILLSIYVDYISRAMKKRD